MGNTTGISGNKKGKKRLKIILTGGVRLAMNKTINGMKHSTGMVNFIKNFGVGSVLGGDNQKD
jgi:hypothetical protein